MRIFALVVLALALAKTANADGPLQLAGYQYSDGAISIFQHGNDVDPYFAGKALLVAHDAGLDIRTVAQAWINWGLQHQRADGGFDRFCRRDGSWVACAPADADDSAAAVWMELLAKLAANAGYPAAWLESIDRAQQLLNSLNNPQSHIYFISAKQPVGLLMDNIEVYTALLAVSRLKQSTGDTSQAQELSRQADVLANNIVRVFWQPCLQRLRVSTQKNIRPGFYPDQVAELFPILGQMTIPGRDQAGFIKAWLNENQAQWFAQANVDFPWGLVAIAADKLGQHASVNCWLTLAKPLRHGRHWNVLEEAVFEALAAGRSGSPQTIPPACTAAKIQKTPPDLLAPENLLARRMSFESIELRWAPVGGPHQADGYEVLRDSQYLGIAREPLFVDKTAVPGKHYTYSVRAYDALGRFSMPATITKVAAESDHFISVYLQSDRPRANIRLQSGDSAETEALAMDNACPGYLTKTINIGQSETLAVSFSDDKGYFDDNQGKGYRLRLGSFAISHGAVVSGVNPCLDLSAPSTPEALTQIAAKSDSIEFAWNAAKDNSSVSRYVVIRNGAEIAETAQQRFTDSCVVPLTTYQYQIRALDADGNRSPTSNELIVTTLPK